MRKGSDFTSTKYGFGTDIAPDSDSDNFDSSDYRARNKLNQQSKV